MSPGGTRKNGMVGVRGSRDPSERAPGGAARHRPGAGNPLTLAPSPDAPRIAREWISARLAGWPPSGVANAALAVSELVTNAMLHAGTTIVLRCEPTASHVRLEVCDARADVPVPSTHPGDASTGLGLRLVSTLAEAWGVTASEDAKAVWCVISAEPSPRDPGGDRHATGGTTPEGAADAHLPTLRIVRDDTERAEGRAVRVALLNLPLSVYDAVSRHADAVARELALIAQSADPRTPDGPSADPRTRDGTSGYAAPRALVELAERVRADFARVAHPLRDQVAHARDAGAATVDLVLDVPVDALESLRALADEFDEADRYCETGDLLTLASPPSLRRFRRWYATQIVGQSHGLAPTPWAHEG